jgi:hypothetical protein
VPLFVGIVPHTPCSVLPQNVSGVFCCSDPRRAKASEITLEEYLARRPKQVCGRLPCSCGFVGNSYLTFVLSLSWRCVASLFGPRYRAVGCSPVLSAIKPRAPSCGAPSIKRVATGSTFSAPTLPCDEAKAFEFKLDKAGRSTRLWRRVATERREGLKWPRVCQKRRPLLDSPSSERAGCVSSFESLRPLFPAGGISRVPRSRTSTVAWGTGNGHQPARVFVVVCSAVCRVLIRKRRRSLREVRVRNN